MKLILKGKKLPGLRGREAELVKLIPKEFTSVPASGSPAGQHQTASRDGQSDFRGFYMTATLWRQGGVYHIGEHSGLSTGGIGID